MNNIPTAVLALLLFGLLVSKIKWPKPFFSNPLGLLAIATCLAAVVVGASLFVPINNTSVSIIGPGYSLQFRVAVGLVVTWVGLILLPFRDDAPDQIEKE